MARSHALLKYKKAQFVLSQVLNDLAESESNDPNYHLDKRQTIVQESLATAPGGTLARVYSENLSSRRARRDRADQKSREFLD